MFRRILVPVDGSPTSNRGLREAIKLAQDQTATLYLVHVVDEFILTQGIDGMTYVTPDYVDEFIDALRKRGKEVLTGAQTLVKKQAIKCQAVLAETMGHPVADVIIEQARKCRADLIVLGTHGRRSLSRLVMGSDAEAVLRASRVPVMLVRLPAARRRVGRKAASRQLRADRARRSIIVK